MAKVAFSSTLSSSDLALKVKAPLIAAAVDGQAVAASGMCPSPARRPLVASRPIQPAPGR
jgi:hypothetical protein